MKVKKYQEEIFIRKMNKMNHLDQAVDISNVLKEKRLNAEGSTNIYDKNYVRKEEGGYFNG